MMTADLSLTIAAKGSPGEDGRERFWRCCQCEQNQGPGPGDLIPSANSTCPSEHRRCDSCVVVLGTQEASEYIGADPTNDNLSVLRHNLATPSSRPLARATSCNSIFINEQRNQPRPSLSPLVSWDDSALDDKYHIALSEEEDRLQKGKNIGIAVRRSANIDVFDDSASDTSLSSRSPSPSESHSEGDTFKDRLLQPHEYFQELDDLGSTIYDRSAFPFYINGTVYKPFVGTIRFDVAFLENASFQNCTYGEILSFCNEVTQSANENAAAVPGAGPHYDDHLMYHRKIEQLTHFIECRNVISGVWENIKYMKEAHYCGNFISSLVLDRTRHGVARLVQVECTKIQELTIAFETCLFQIISLDPVMVLLDEVATVSADVSRACQEMLTMLGMNILISEAKDLWRCAVHILDIVVLSYMGAHTQFLGSESEISVALPGPFVEKQYFRFCRRTFSCLGKFLGGQEAWVLELYNVDTLHLDLPPLCLLTDAVTFGDIWGPMWKSCVLGQEERIIQYSVGNGAIVPWNRPTSTSLDKIELEKGEVFCHWISNKESRDQDGIDNSLTLHGNDTILIGAPIRLNDIGSCKASTADHRQRLRNSGSLTEPGTIKPGRVLDSETVQAQVMTPHVALGYQRQYKRRGRSMKDCLVEIWKNSHFSRQVKCLEFKLGLEVSTCTYNARRIRLVELFGTQTMLNYLQNGSLPWQSAECRESFYSALQSSDYKAFRKLYESRPDWQSDLGNAIQCCFDALADTGKVEKDLVMFWAPDPEPGERVTLKPNDLSWIGFLEDTETSGTLAVLESKCLELPDLDIGRKCSSNHFDPRHIDRGLSTGTFQGSILETSVQLNKVCVPTSIVEGHIRSKRRDGTPAKHSFRWSLLSLKEGDKFEFGKKGTLKTITQLTQGQILAKWSNSLDVKRQLHSMSSKVLVLGGLIHQPPPNIHYECIGDRGNEITSPVSFIILSTAKSILHSAEASRRSSFRAALTSSSSDHQTNPYSFDSSNSGRPRIMNSDSQPVRAQDTANDLRNIINRWQILRTPKSPPWPRQDIER